MADDAPGVIQYLNDHIFQHLRANADHGFPGWTSNNVESINHVLKNINQWHQHKLPHLIRNIKAAVSTQYVDAEKAMYGEGDYSLKPHLRARFSRDYDTWTSLDAKKRSKLLTNCFRLHTKGSTSLSTDGRLTVTVSANAGKKRHQHKRPPNERTVSVSKRHRS